MFSVTGESPASVQAGSALYIGLEPTVFEYRGGNNTDPFYFSDPIYRARIELPGLHFFLGYNNKVANGDSLSFLNVGAALDGQIYLHRSLKSQISVPINLKTDYTQLSFRFTNANLEDFRQSSVLIGSGLLIRYSITRAINISARVSPQYGFSVTSFGGTGGSIFIFENGLRLNFDQLFNQYGISVGYDYRTSRYDLEMDIFNYKTLHHSFLIGLTF